MAKTAKRVDEAELKSVLDRLLSLLGREKEAEAVNENSATPFLCAIQPLPRDKWVAAAERAVQINPANRPATHLLGMPGVAALSDIASPEAIAVLTSKYWGSGGVQLTVGFLEPIQQDLREHILSHMNAWGAYGNVQFVYSNSDPQVRITPHVGRL